MGLLKEQKSPFDFVVDERERLEVGLEKGNLTSAIKELGIRGSASI